MTKISMLFWDLLFILPPFYIVKSRRNNNGVLDLALKTDSKNYYDRQGHVDPGESEYETAVRETKEEAGLNEDQLHVFKDFQQVLNYEVRGKPKRVVYWLAELNDPQTDIVLSEEHMDYRWLCLDDALQFVKYQDMQNSLKEVDSYLLKSGIKP